MHRFLFGLLFASIANIGLAAAEDPAPAASDTVVVVGQRTEEAIRSFIDELAATPRGVDQLSRWDWRICPGVAGLRPHHAQFVIDRMAQRAFDVGLRVGEPGCRANVLIIVSMDPDTIAEQIFEGNRRALGYYSERGQSTLGREPLREFVASDAPVRWWHVSHEYTQAGELVEETMMGEAPMIVRHGGPSLLRRGTHHNLTGALIIVDGRRISDGFDLGALADYLAMVTLAQIDPAAETQGLSTILNLFGQPDAPRALTEWDVGYLRGLYATNIDDNGQRQQSTIARTMEQGIQEQ
jgi:hypothetical protein